MSEILNIGNGFVDGLKAFVSGVERSVRSESVRSSYVKFTMHCLIITLVGYAIVSATLTSIIPLVLILLLGPILGPIVLLVLSYVFVTALIVLWFLDKFPSKLFTGSFGLLRPFFSVPQISFLLATVLIPLSCDEFMLMGIDNDENLKKKENPIRKHYKAPRLYQTMFLFGCNFVLNACVRTLFVMLFFWTTKKEVWIDPVVSAFLLGCDLTSVYTYRIRGMSYVDHLRWCFKNAPRIIGFGLPFGFIQESSWMFSFLWLGLAYSAASALVEDLVIADVTRTSPKTLLKETKIF